MRSLASVRRAREREREKRKGGGQEAAKAAREVVIPDVITVQELAGRMAIRAVEILKFLAREGVMLKGSDVIDTDTAELVYPQAGAESERHHPGAGHAAASGQPGAGAACSGNQPSELDSDFE